MTMWIGQNTNHKSSDCVPILPHDQQENFEATSTDFSPNAKIVLALNSRNRQIPGSFSAGLACSLGSFIFTWWLSTQIFQCPEWALYCRVESSAATFSKNLGVVQGIVMTVYGLGLAGLTFTTYMLLEAAVWPLLRLQTYNRLGIA
ncbi:hypothetical protein IWX47DRAFT_3940 [Phyllosticta citricarpa]